MEDKIEVGDYVKSKSGRILHIDKIEKIIKDIRIEYRFWDTQQKIWGKYSDFVKHSKNIIDLIEVGDYVNGYKVISVDYDVKNPYIDCIELDLNNNYQYNFISINQIKDILTKEEFDRRKFEV